MSKFSEVCKHGSLARSCGICELESDLSDSRKATEAVLKRFEERTALIPELQAENNRLREALSVSRGQWIHSVNAKQCLEALGEGKL